MAQKFVARRSFRACPHACWQAICCIDFHLKNPAKVCQGGDRFVLATILA